MTAAKGGAGASGGALRSSYARAEKVSGTVVTDRDRLRPVPVRRGRGQAHER
ncbi:hypothetical protein [Streptomyces sp. KL116D]|uniref:hypothetical protein n=1 Tax=Streptomyces sp. KL116D TaxID=3045152 RepID=UPI003558101C